MTDTHASANAAIAQSIAAASVRAAQCRDCGSDFTPGLIPGATVPVHCIASDMDTTAEFDGQSWTCIYCHNTIRTSTDHYTTADVVWVE